MPSKGTFGWNICLEPFLGCFLLSTLELYKPHEWASGFRFGQVNLSWGMWEECTRTHSLFTFIIIFTRAVQEECNCSDDPWTDTEARSRPAATGRPFASLDATRPHCCRAHCRASTLSQSYLGVEFCALTFRHRDCPPRTAQCCTSLSWESHDGVAASPEDTAACRACYHWAPSGGRLVPWPSRSQPHSGVKFLLKHLFNFTAACRTGDLQLTSRSWKRVWCLQPYGYGCQKMAAKVNCLIRCTFKMTWWWHYQSDKNDNDFIL